MQQVFLIDNDCVVSILEYKLYLVEKTFVFQLLFKRRKTPESRLL